LLYTIQCATPLTGAMESYIALATEVYDTKESAKALKAAQAIGANELRGASSLIAGRSWPLLEAAHSSIEKAALTKCEQLGDKSLFKAYPSSVKTVELNSKIFKFQSREAAVLYAFGIYKHTGFPWVLWRALNDPAAIEEANNICLPGRGVYGRAFLEHYGSFDNEMGKVESAIIVVNSSVATVAIENGNAKLNRSLKAKSNQTKKPLLATLASEDIIGQVRVRESRALFPVGSKVPRKVRRDRRDKRRRNPKGSSTGSQNHGVIQKVQKRGGGGACRAFMSVRCRGQNSKARVILFLGID
jgi:hypothetical protein